MTRSIVITVFGGFLLFGLISCESIKSPDERLKQVEAYKEFNVFSEPEISEKSRAIRVIKKGKIINVLEQTKNFSKIKLFGRRVGYIFEPLTVEEKVVPEKRSKRKNTTVKRQPKKREYKNEIQPVENLPEESELPERLEMPKLLNPPSLKTGGLDDLSIQTIE